MIECANCETGQFLQITQSRVYFEDGEEVSETSEEYECTLCGATGGYEKDEGEEPSVTGDMQVIEGRESILWP